jgi:two-component system LytT family sensor kinase
VVAVALRLPLRRSTAWSAPWAPRSGRQLNDDAELATFRTLHTASLAARSLRGGLGPAAAEKALPHLGALLGTPSVALTDNREVLAWHGGFAHHRAMAAEFARRAPDVTMIHDRQHAPCRDPACPVESTVVCPLAVDEAVVGTLQVCVERTSGALVRAVEEVAGWVSGQLELAELDASRRRLVEAEVRALRAQISPHFVYNSLNAIAASIRTDPEHARELVLEFADFTRYSFRRHGEFTTLAEELRSIDRYLLLERARFGDRLQVTVQVAPEVLPVSVPFLCVQPLVENAVRHGLEGKPGPGRVTIVARDVGQEALICVEDDGAGIDPDAVRRTLAGDPEGDSIGLGNVDERLRQVYGDDYGLVVETAPGAGTKVSMRVPKYRAGVHP